LLGGQPLTLASISAINEQMVQDGVTVSRTSACCDDHITNFDPFVTSVTYYRDDLRSLGRAIAGTDDFELTRSNWLAAKAHNWEQIWRVPALFIFVWFVVFFIFGRDPKEEGPTGEAPETNTQEPVTEPKKEPTQ
jgi:hypothetical protein